MTNHRCAELARWPCMETLEPRLLLDALTVNVTSPPGDFWTTGNDVLVSADVQSSLAAYAFINWDDSLVGWWTAEDGVNDQSGHDNDARLMGDAYVTSAGKFGNAFQLDGSGDYLSMCHPGQSPSLDHYPDFDFTEDDSFTMSAWVYKTSSDDMAVLHKGWELFYHESGRWQFSLEDLHAYWVDPSPTYRWIHLAGVYDAQAGKISLYVDGVLRSSRTGTVTDLSTRKPLKIGTVGWGRHWKGKLDEIAIFARALRGDEIKSLYDAKTTDPAGTFNDLAELDQHAYEVMAVNADGDHVSSGAATVMVDEPNTPPAVSLDGPLDETRSSNSTQTFNFSADDTNDYANTTLSFATFYWDYGGSFAPAGTVPLSGEADSGSFRKTGIAEGTYTWNVLVTDSNGNSAFAGHHHTLVIGPTEYYVATTGDDGDSGAFDAPFRTIQHAAGIARPGDTIYVRGGTYRETITPARSGNALAEITFKAYPGETVTVSGANLLSGWSPHSGSIYRATMPVNLGKGENQVFVDGQMMFWARWPNTPDLDVMRPELNTIDSGSGSTTTYIYTLNDADITQGSNYWKDAVIHVTYNPKYWTHTGTVTSSGVGTLTFLSEDRGYGPYPAGGQYYLTGTYVALDMAGEWYYDTNTRRIYLWAPGDDDPDNHVVEVKARDKAFDLRGRSYVTVEGFDIFASTVVTDEESHHVTLDRLDAAYVDHFTLLGSDHGAWATNDSGFILDGHHNVLKNSHIQYSAGNGVSLIGDDSTVTNCTIHDVNYVGVYCGTVNTGSRRTKNNVITRSTLYNSGRDVVQHAGAENIKITHNEMYGTNVGYLTRDLGVTYANVTDFMGAEIAYNVVHDSGYTYAGIYLDAWNEDISIHHNVVYGVRYAFLAHKPIAQIVEHNTLDPLKSYHSVIGTVDETIPASLNRMVFRNNIFTGHTMSYGDGTTWENNIDEVTDPGFVDQATKEYSLRSDSIAIDAGAEVAYQTDKEGNPVYGTPDIGALEYQPTLEMGVDALQVPSQVRIYGDGGFRYVAMRGGGSAELTVAPSGGWDSFGAQDKRPFWMDLDITDWNGSAGHYRRWVEADSALGPAEMAAYTVGGLAPGADYLLRADGVAGAGIAGPGVSDGVVQADAQGFIQFTYTGPHANTLIELGMILPGDADRDGDVDTDDLNALLGSFGTSAGWTGGDFSFDGIAGDRDLSLLLRNLGEGLAEVTVTATDADASEDTLDPGVFRIGRGAWNAGDLDVGYTLSGTADAGDFQPVPGTVTIPHGQTYADVVITPVSDDRMETAETVILAVSAGAGYAVGDPGSATVTIAASDEVIETFESGEGSGGTGWSAPWTCSGGASIVGGLVHSGLWQLGLTGVWAEAVRSVDLSEAPNAQLRLYWRTHSFEVGDYATVEIYDGSQWYEVLRLADEQEGYVYHLAEIDLSPFTLTADFQLRMSSYLGGTGEYFFVDDILIKATESTGEVVGRQVSYDASAWAWAPASDTNENGRFDAGEDGANDDNAIAADEAALLPGQTATFVNCTSHSRGINGIMVDIDEFGDPEGLVLAMADEYLAFDVGIDEGVASWEAASAPKEVAVRAGTGAGGSDRAPIISDDNNGEDVTDPNEAVAKANPWLQVTVKAGARTGLGVDAAASSLTAGRTIAARDLLDPLEEAGGAEASPAPRPRRLRVMRPGLATTPDADALAGEIGPEVGGRDGGLSPLP